MKAAMHHLVGINVSLLLLQSTGASMQPTLCVFRVLNQLPAVCYLPFVRSMAYVHSQGILTDQQMSRL